MNIIFLVAVLPVFLSLPYQSGSLTIFLPITTGWQKDCIAWDERENTSIEGLSSCYHDWASESVNPEPNYTRYNSLPCRCWPYSGDCERDHLSDLRDLEGGIILFANEPDRHDQCLMTPEETYLLYLDGVMACRNCEFTMPQYSSNEYCGDWPNMRAFLEFYTKAPGFVPRKIIYGAVHIYYYLDSTICGNPVSIAEYIDSYNSVMLEYGMSLPIVVSEYGSCDPGTVWDMTAQILDRDDVLVAFYFTTHSSTDNGAITSCTNLCEGFGQCVLNGNGRAYMRAVSGLPFP